MTPILLDIQLLGDFLLTFNNTPITPITVPRMQSLLAYLLLHRDAPQNRSHLAYLLWPDSTEAQAHTNLRKLLYQLRQAFPEIDHFLSVDKQSLQWLPASGEASWTLDILEIEQAITRREQAEQVQDMTAMRQALERVMQLYRGDLLPSCYDEWILPERDRFRQYFLSSAERLITHLEQERDYEAAIATAQHLLRQDPLHEATYRQLMRLFALQGNRAAALRVYHTCVTVLERELGAEPSEVTRAAYEALLQSDTAETPTTGPLAPRGTEAPLVGRKAEWRRLQDAWRKSASGHPQIVILSGEAGIGKTRLAEEMIAWASRQGIATTSAHCYSAEGRLAYAPVTAWLRAGSLQSGLSTLDPVWLTEVARLLPDLLIKRPKLPHPAPLIEGWQRQHFFEALAHALLNTHQPLLLLLDDLQWCDKETQEWLHYLLHFDPHARLLLLGTVRSEETLPDHPLMTFMNALQREGLVTEITLNPLDTAETISLAEHIIGYQLNPTTTDTLYKETEGNPLFIVEMVRAGTLVEREEEQPISASSPSLLTQLSSELPPTVQSVLSTRLAQLSPQAREVANVAAVIGREFTFAVLAQASGESEDMVVRGLDELWQRRIVRERGTGTADTYDFSHDKLRVQTYASLGPAHRRRLHRRIAEALIAIYAEDLDTVSGEIAAHYEQASLPEQAIPYYQRAGRVAMRIYANTEALSAFQRAVVLLETDVPGNAWRKKQWEVIARVYASLGDTLVMMGQHEQARHAYQSGMSHVSATDVSDQRSIWQARLLRKIASTWTHASVNPLDTSHVQAHQTFQEAEHILEQAVVKSNTEWLHEWIDLQIAQLLPLRGSLEEMTAVIEKAQATIMQYGTPEQRAQFLQAVAARDVKRDRYTASEASVIDGRNALIEVQKTGNKNLIGFSQFSLANRLLWSDHLDEAEETMQTAMNLAEQIGNTTLLARCLTFLPFIFRRRGLVEDTRAIVTRALTVPEARNSPLIKGHRAWIAWRDGNLIDAEAYGHASLEDSQGQQRSNPFRWAGLWPLIGIALTQEKPLEAITYIHILLDPTQQPPLEPLNTLLEAVLHTWNAGQQEHARILLEQALPPAQEMGYL